MGGIGAVFGKMVDGVFEDGVFADVERDVSDGVVGCKDNISYGRSTS